jgi:hypothetical protein
MRLPINSVGVIRDYNSIHLFKTKVEGSNVHPSHRSWREWERMQLCMWNCSQHISALQCFRRCLQWHQGFTLRI